MITSYLPRRRPAEWTRTIITITVFKAALNAARTAQQIIY